MVSLTAGALGDGAVERAAGEVALQVEEVGGRLHFGEALEGGRGVLEALAAVLGDFLADLLDALGGDLGGGDERLDIAPGQVGELLDDLRRTLDGGLGALVDVAENGLELLGRELAGFDPSLVLVMILAPSSS